MERREELERWIAGSRATWRTLRIALLAGVVIALALMFISRAVGGIALAIVGFVAGAGYWITAGHIADWQQRLYKLDHPDPQATDTRKRRYQSD